MIDLQNQYFRIKDEIDDAIHEVLNSAKFIKGAQVAEFEAALARYHEVETAVSCGNGTDALQIALMTLDLKPGDEVILPAYTYVATAEVIALLKLKPVFVDVDYDTFNIDVAQIPEKISPKTKAIIGVNLFGQCAELELLKEISQHYDIHLIEDNAQSIGGSFRFRSGTEFKAGTVGDIGCLSFFPSKNLGCFGDGGAMIFKDPRLAERARMIANHGQKVKYHHDIIGCNSRLDTIQAAVLNVKLKYLDQYNQKRKEVVSSYNQNLKGLEGIILPVAHPRSTHVYNQYTLKLPNFDRDQFRTSLKEKGVPSMVYYPIPLHLQKAYQDSEHPEGSLPVSERLSKEVLSLPLHTELNQEKQDFIIQSVKTTIEEMVKVPG